MVPPVSDRISLVPPYSGYSYAATRFQIHGFHVLWPNFPDRSSNKLQSTLLSYNPGHAVTPPVWAVPRSLATTCGITVVFSSCLGCSAFARHYLRNHCCFLFLQVLRCFSSLRSPHFVVISLLDIGFPHSEIPASMVICTYTGLIAACHVLLRL